MLNCRQPVEHLQALHPGAESPALVALIMSFGRELGDLVAKAPRVRTRPLTAEILPYTSQIPVHQNSNVGKAHEVNPRNCLAIHENCVCVSWGRLLG